jgi:hypothetical protein
MVSFERDMQAKILQRIYNRATSEEQLWVVRIILKGNFLVFHK